MEKENSAKLNKKYCKETVQDSNLKTQRSIDNKSPKHWEHFLWEVGSYMLKYISYDSDAVSW